MVFTGGEPLLRDDLAERVADRVVIIDHGRVIASEYWRRWQNLAP